MGLGAFLGLFPVGEPSAVPGTFDEFIERGSRFEPAPRAVFVVFAYVRWIFVFRLTPRGFRQAFDRLDVVLGFPQSLKLGGGISPLFR